nr:MAG: hypothetical protein DIU58_05890 [Sphaerobacter thermophilus]
MTDTALAHRMVGLSERPVARARTAGGLVVAAFGGVILLGAGLIFFVEPMIAKMALPRYGRSPSVWNTSVVVFQTLLLLGYTYAWPSHGTAPPQHA